MFVVSWNYRDSLACKSNSALQNLQNSLMELVGMLFSFGRKWDDLINNSFKAAENNE